MHDQEYLDENGNYKVNTGRINAKGQITIPKSLRSKLGLFPGDWVEIVEIKNGVLVQKKVSLSRFAKYRGFLKHLKGQTSEEIIENMRDR